MSCLNVMIYPDLPQHIANIDSIMENIENCSLKTKEAISTSTSNRIYLLNKTELINHNSLWNKLQMSPVDKHEALQQMIDGETYYAIPEENIQYFGMKTPVTKAGGKKSERNATKKKKGGAVPIHSQSTVLQSASYAPSLDNSFLSQSTLVGGKKKRTQRKRKSLKKKSRKH